MLETLCSFVRTVRPTQTFFPSQSPLEWISEWGLNFSAILGSVSNSIELYLDLRSCPRQTASLGEFNLPNGTSNRRAENRQSFIAKWALEFRVYPRQLLTRLKLVHNSTLRQRVGFDFIANQVENVIAVSESNWKSGYLDSSKLIRFWLCSDCVLLAKCTCTRLVNVLYWKPSHCCWRWNKGWMCEVWITKFESISHKVSNEDFCHEESSLR